MSNVKHWRYYIPSGEHGGWGIVFLDSFGVISAITDYGNFGYRWGSIGDADFRKWFCDLNDPAYLISKFGMGMPKTYNSKQSLLNARQAIAKHALELREEYQKQCRNSRNDTLCQPYPKVHRQNIRDFLDHAKEQLEEHNALRWKEDFERWVDDWSNSFPRDAKINCYTEGPNWSAVCFVEQIGTNSPKTSANDQRPA